MDKFPPDFINDVESCGDRLVSKAAQLVTNKTTNISENFMSIRCKMDGGEYFNRVRSGSFQHRSMAAALRVQYGPGWTTSILNQMGIQSQPQDEYTKRRKQKCELDNARKVCLKYKKRRLESRGHSCTNSSLDSSYGSTPAEPDIPEVELLQLCKEHLDRLKVSSEDIDNICQCTIDQNDDISGKWMKQRRGRVTASSFGAIAKRKSSFVPLVKRLLYAKHVTTRAMRYGHLHEVHARNAYTTYLLDKHKDATVMRTGLHIDPKHNWIGTSPDGIVNDPSSVDDPHGLLEIKCPASAESTSLEELCGTSNFFLKYVDGKFHLKKSHDYYYQIQGQLHVTCRSWCDLVVWTPLGVPPSPPTSPSYTPIMVERINVDEDFWNAKIFPKLADFYMKHMFPEIASPRHLSAQPIREQVPFDYTQ